MAIYHFSAQVISRGSGKSSVAASAYRSGEKLTDERLGVDHDYTRRGGVTYSEILTPSNAPEWANDRNRLWNEVEKIEKSKDSQLSREINIALPVELSREQQIELIRKYVKENFVDKGMAADISMHDKMDGNPHAHIMLTVRPFNEDGTWGAKARKEYILDKNGEKIKQGKEYKSRKVETTDWNKKETLENWREQWANHANKALEKAGFQERIDHRTLADQGLDRKAQIHVGVHAAAMERKGIPSERGIRNNEIKQLNEQIKNIEKEKVVALQEYRELKAKLEQEKAKDAQRYSNLKPEEKAAVQKAEKILKEPQTYENSNRALVKLNDTRQDIALKLSKIDFEAGEIRGKLSRVVSGLEGLKKAQNEFNELSKNLFGQYKDKERAEIIKATIQRHNNDLAREGYKSSVDIRLNERKLEELQKNIGELKSKIQVIDQASTVIKEGVKALQNKELREFYKEYKQNFPQAKYLRYSDMKAIKAATELMGRPVSIEEIKANYRKKSERLDSVNKELRGIEENGRRLLNAKQALETIEKYKDIADKWDTKVFGKIKFQEEYRTEKWEYDNAVNRLKEFGIRDKLDLRSQERIHESSVKEVQPKLQVEKAAIAPAINILQGALQALDGAMRAERQQQRQEELKLTKAFKGRNMEDELEHGM